MQDYGRWNVRSPEDGKDQGTYPIMFTTVTKELQMENKVSLSVHKTILFSTLAVNQKGCLCGMYICMHAFLLHSISVYSSECVLF